MRSSLPDQQHVIPALRDLSQWSMLPSLSKGAWVFLLGGTVEQVCEPTMLLQRRGFSVFVHIDMLGGLTTDHEGLRFLQEYAGPDGIISTHRQTLIQAKKLGFSTVQRIFLLDSKALTTGISQVQAVNPTAVEVLPGILPDYIRSVALQVSCPVIAGGLVTDMQEVRLSIEAGAKAISTSSLSLVDTAFSKKGGMP